MDFLEILRISKVAATEAAEAIVDKTELIEKKSLSELENGNAELFILKNGKIENSFKSIGSKRNLKFVEIWKIGQDYIYKLKSEDQFRLRINFDFSNRKKKEIIYPALKAIQYVFSSYEKIVLSKKKM